MTRIGHGDPHRPRRPASATATRIGRGDPHRPRRPASAAATRIGHGDLERARRHRIGAPRPRNFSIIGPRNAREEPIGIWRTIEEFDAVFVRRSRCRAPGLLLFGRESLSKIAPSNI
jgi:hypothetical protein